MPSMAEVMIAPVSLAALIATGATWRLSRRRERRPAPPLPRHGKRRDPYAPLHYDEPWLDK